MNFKQLCEIIIKYNIPADVTLMSGSGWEAGETDVSVLYYNHITNTLMICGSATDKMHYIDEVDWVELL